MAQNEPWPWGESPESLFSSFQSANVEFSLDWDRRLVVVKFEGSVTLQEIAKYVESLVVHPTSIPHFRRLPISEVFNISICKPTIS